MTDDASKSPPNPPPPQPSGGGAGKPSAAGGKPRTFQSPKGTRDFYPQDLLRRRYIIDTWRRVSLRHGFEEIDGPTFEDSELYTVKSGEGILNELFGAYSGKDPNDTKQVQGGGPPPFALRPEFTPTLARLYAARAKQLAQPTKWFCVSNFFRAERPQRGRLREFWQWNADVLGGGTEPIQIAEADVESISCLAECLFDLGVDDGTATIRFNHRGAVRRMLSVNYQVSEERIPHVFEVLDAAPKLDVAHLATSLCQRGNIPEASAHDLAAKVKSDAKLGGDPFTAHWPIMRDSSDASWGWSSWGPLLEGSSVSQHLRRDVSIVRGLAYYTGTVFELIAEGERAVAGGGRYDKLIELFGGPPTPAVGFGMGDVVLTNLLDDRKLMPEGRDLLEATSRPLPVRPDVFVIANEAEESQQKVVPLVASLRRGVESDKYKQGGCKPWSDERYTVPPLHARRTYKATKNIGKLLADATACHARYALIIENGETGTLKNLDSGEQQKEVPLGKVGGLVASG